MIFALSTDDCTLYVFSNEEEATSYADGGEVEQGGWLFFDGDGHVMEPVFSGSSQPADIELAAGEYCLMPVPGNPVELLGLLPAISTVEGKAPFDNVDMVEQLLSFQSSALPPGTLH